MRDLEQIKRILDLEVVLQHYGYRFVKSKSSTVSRIYRKGEQRLSVIVDGGFAAKFFADLNDPQFKGDIFKFMERMEHGNYRQIFEKIELMMAQSGTLPDVFAKKIDLPEQSVVEPVSDRRREDIRLREQDLYRKFQITPLTDTEYLESRYISKDVLFSKEFEGRLKNVTFDNGVIQYANTAFPMYARNGNIQSMDIRNMAYKAFPKGERGEALWRSNQFFEAKRALKAENGLEIPVGTLGTLYRRDTENFVFMYGEVGKEMRLIVPYEQAKTGLNEVPVHRIIISESPIDAISLKQLNPEKANERRLYVATCGQPSGKQLAFLQEILNQNPQAQFVIAQDGDNAGLRFAVNYLVLDHPSEDPEMKIKPYLMFSSTVEQQPKKIKESTQTQESTGMNRLKLELRYPLAAGARKAQELNEGFIRALAEEMNLFASRIPKNCNDKSQKNKEQQIEHHLQNIPITETMLDENMQYLITRTEIHFLNNAELTTKVLKRISDEIENRQGQKLFQFVCLTPQQKDLNNVLKELNGQALPSSHPLTLPELPVIKSYQDIQKDKKAGKENVEHQWFMSNNNKIIF
ncbi:hypothetical protein DR864_28825 (plasmid) [Runella rosea]|uniref:Toprim domain-containing protein n=1 Tax=Runella rosea TaxID=2259595 RepID=A0A344TT99_9BACT|nr:toprim domain-containing protein [Runella rosea]AXE21870.1 hypothetical protein DR864_28825 [Runella rosea]